MANPKSEPVDLMAALKASLAAAKAASDTKPREDDPFPSAFKPCSHEGEHPEVKAHLNRERPTR